MSLFGGGGVRQSGGGMGRGEAPPPIQRESATFGFLSRFLPRIRRGQTITAKTLSTYAEAIERSLPIVASGTGLSVTQLPNGLGMRTNQVFVGDFLTTSSITKRSGTTLGKGTAKRQLITAEGKYLDTLVAYTIYSKWTDKSVNSGSYVTCVYNGSVWEVVDADDCTHLSS